jgi:hypothetical protein
LLILKHGTGHWILHRTATCGYLEGARFIPANARDISFSHSFRGSSLLSALTWLDCRVQTQAFG